MLEQLWQQAADWFWKTLAALAFVVMSLIGIVYSGVRRDIKSNKDEIARLDGELKGVRESIDRKLEAAEERRREDTSGLHKKIDAGFDRLGDKIDRLRQ